MKKTIAIACDHADYEVKNSVATHLKNQGYTVLDLGTNSADQVDYPDFALLAAQAVATQKADLGILICGTGIGMSIAANKVKGIRCAHVTDEFSAKATREHNDANMMATGVRILSQQQIIALVDIFVATPFSNEQRHQRRIDKITQIENN